VKNILLITLLYSTSILSIVYAFYLRLTTGSAGGFTFMAVLGAMYLMLSLGLLYKDRKL
jgi:hypothetical protein